MWIKKIADFIAGRIIEEGLASKDKKEWYVYSFERYIEAFTSMVTIMMLGLLLGKLMPTVLFLIFFHMLRRRSGGFHCTEFWQCYVLSTIIFWGMVLLEPYMRNYQITMNIMTLTSAAVVVDIGTVNHPNMAYETKELRYSSKLTRIIVVSEVFILGLLQIIGVGRVYISYMSLSIILCAILIVLAKIINQEVGNNEKERALEETTA